MSIICHKLKSPISIFGFNILKEKIVIIEDFSKLVIKNAEALRYYFPNFKSTIEKIYMKLKTFL